MTRRIGDAESPRQCDLCGKVGELRPFGPEGEMICYDCAASDEDTTDRMMDRVRFNALDNAPAEMERREAEVANGIYWTLVNGWMVPSERLMAEGKLAYNFLDGPKEKKASA